MSRWRIRVRTSDDPRSQNLLTAALAGQHVCSRVMTPGPGAEMTADVVIELPGLDGLGTLLSDLHMISPQVFVSSADRPIAASQPAAGAPGAQPPRLRPRSALPG